MPNWYPIIRPGDREYVTDLPIRIRHFFLSQPRSLRDDYPTGWPNGGITLWGFVERGAGYAVGDLVTVLGGNDDAVARVLTVDGGAVMALDWVSLGSGYATGEAATLGGTGTGLTLLITEVA